MAIGFGVRQGNPRTAREVAMLAAALSTTKVAIFPKSGNRIQEKVERGRRQPPYVGSLVGENHFAFGE